MTNEEAVNVLRIMASGIELKGYSDHWILNFREAYEMAFKSLENKRPQGEWIDTGRMEEYWAEEYQCSICGEKDHWHNFCPNCGADMRSDHQTMQ